MDEFEAYLMDKYDRINWSRLRKFQMPLSTYKFKKSWVYRYSYRVALRKQPSRIYWVCHWCFQHRATDTGRGIFSTTSSISAAARHLAEKRTGHNIKKLGAPPSDEELEQQSIYHALKAGKLPVSQAVANKLAGFNIQRFRLAAVGWLVDNNYSLSEFEKPAFRALIKAANPVAEDALWRSHVSVSTFVLRLYDHLFPRVVCELSRAISKIHISFNG